MAKKHTGTQHELERYWKILSPSSVDETVYHEAMQWMQEHADEVRELDNMISSNDRKARRYQGEISVEDAENIKTQPNYDPEAFLPAEIRHILYDDRRWFDQAEYMQPDADEADRYLWLDRKIMEALHQLTEKQREALFRTVVNGESTESVAADWECSARNVRDIRARALAEIRKRLFFRARRGEGDILTAVKVLFVVAAVGSILYWLFPPMEPSTISEAAIGAIVAVAMMIRWLFIGPYHLRRYWARLNGEPKRK